MNSPWESRELLRELSARGRHPAVISYGDDETLIWDGATLAHNALKLARSLRQRGIDGGSRVVLWAPKPDLIASALAILAAGAVLVPVDDLADASQLEMALASSSARLLLTTARYLEDSGGILSKRSADLMLVDAPEFLGGDAATSVMPPDDRAEDFPVPGDDAPTVLSWTSGTTGAPKAFVLTHGNIATNVAALRDLALVGPQDRALLPLPLHHAYPFVVGLLTPLTLGAAITLPGGTTGPLLMKALQVGQVTAIVGVPRLYEALEAGIEARLDAGGRAARLTWRSVSRLVIFMQRRTGLCLGRFVFAPVRHAIAPRLRLLVSGGDG